MLLQACITSATLIFAPPVRADKRGRRAKEREIDSCMNTQEKFDLQHPENGGRIAGICQKLGKSVLSLSIC